MNPPTRHTVPLIAFLAALSVVVFPVRGDSLTCYSATGASAMYSTTSCAADVTPTMLLDWGDPLQYGGLGAAIYPNSATTDAGTLGWSYQGAGTYTDPTGRLIPLTVTAASSFELVRADNVENVWTGTTWENVNFADPQVENFVGNFGAPTSTTSPEYGDDLLGVVCASGGSCSTPSMTFDFQDPLAYIAFQISSASQQNFTATLAAYNSSGQEIGSTKIVDQGDGGEYNCTGMGSTPPSECDTAPLIQFYDPAAESISQVVVTVTGDDSGFYIDTVEATPGPPVPEPSTLIPAATGLAVVLWAGRRKTRRWVTGLPKA